MTTKELYESYLAKKTTVELLQAQLSTINISLYEAEQELINLTSQIKEASDQALLNILGL